MKHIVSVDTKPKNTHATVVSISSLFKKKKKKKSTTTKTYFSIHELTILKDLDVSLTNWADWITV